MGLIFFNFYGFYEEFDLQNNTWIDNQNCQHILAIHIITRYYKEALT